MSEKQHHDEFYGSESDVVLQSPLMRYKRVAISDFLVSVSKGRSRRVLSIGCGEGSIELMAASELGHLLGIDISDVGIARAKQRAIDTNIHNVEFRAQDCHDLSFLEDEEPFDAVWALGLLHHMHREELLALLRSAKGALKPGGVFVSADPSSRRVVGALKFLYRNAYRRHHSPDEREMDLGFLKGQFQAAGFRLRQVHYHDFFVGPVAWVHPGIPPLAAKWLWRLDGVLRSIPLVRRYSNAFMVVAQKPS